MHLGNRFVSKSLPAGIFGLATATTGVAGPSRGLPDLRITQIIHTPAQPVAGQPVQVYVTFLNDSDVDIVDYVDIDIFRDSTNPPMDPCLGDCYGCYNSIWGMNAHTSATLPFTVTYSTPGPQRLWAIADSCENVAESNESNNDFSHDLTIAPPAGYPDLTITNISHAPAQVFVGQPVLVSVTIQNNSTFEASPFDVIIVSDSSGVPLEPCLDGDQVECVDGLAPNATMVVPFEFPYATAGPRRLWVFVDGCEDPEGCGDVVESNELNNFTSHDLTVDGIACPGDLDGNLAVGIQDLSILLAHFGSVGGALASDGDLDGDRDVDLQDLANMLANFGRICLEAPPPPTNLRMDPNGGTASSVRVLYDNVAGEYGYRAYISLDGSIFDSVPAATAVADELSMNIEGLEPETPYWIVVRAWNVAGESPDSNIIQTIITTPSDPVWITVMRRCPGTLRVTWAAVNHATHYRLAKLDEGEDPENPQQWDNYGGDLYATTIDVINLLPSTAYKFRAKACNDNNDCSSGTVSGWRTTSPQPVPNDPPPFTPVPISQSCIEVTWEPVCGADHYRLAILDQGEDPANEHQWDNVGGNLSGTTFMVCNLSPQTLYMFRVKACNSNGCSPGRVSDWVGTLPLPNPTSCTGTPLSPTSMRVEWSAVAGADHYRLAKLDQGEDPGCEPCWDNYGGNLYSTSIDVNDLSPITAYRFRAKACNATNNCSSGTESTWVQTLTPAPPTYTVANAGCHYIDIHMENAFAGATRVEVQWGVCGSGQSQTDVYPWPRDQAIRMDNLAICTNYCVYVRACNQPGCTDWWGGPIATACLPGAPPAPTNCIAARQGPPGPPADPILITWDYAGPPVSGFRVARIGPFDSDIGCPPTSDPAWNNISGDLPAGARQHLDTTEDLENGKIYYYIVRAYIDGPCPPRVFSEYSNCDAARP